MNIFLLKLTTIPLITGIAALLGKRFGHAISGLIIGLPLNAGPIFFFMAIENGNVFAINLINGILFGIISLALFSLVYTKLSKVFNFIISIILSWSIYFLSIFIFSFIHLNIYYTFFLVIISLIIILILFPKYKYEKAGDRNFQWDILSRIVLATVFVIFITYISKYIGPNLSGLITPFPIFGSIFAIFTHYYYGHNSTIILFRNVIKSLFSFAVFFLIVGIFLSKFDIKWVFTIAIISSLSIQTFLLFYKRVIQKVTPIAIVKKNINEKIYSQFRALYMGTKL